MMRPWHVWLSFVACLAVVLAAMGWTSLKVLELERSGAEARRQAALEENVRLALWRMESIVSPLIALESSRPYFWYSAFYPAERPYTRMFAELQPTEPRLASPLLTASAPNVLVNFQIEPGGRLTSPQVPSATFRAEAERGYTSRDRIEQAEARLARLASSLDRSALWAALPLDASPPRLALTQPAAVPQQTWANNQQQARSSIEGTKRAQVYQQMAQNTPFDNVFCAACPDVRAGMMKPLWMGDALILARKVSIDRAEYVQGCELDWPAIRKALITDVTDLLPNADVQPVLGPEPDRQTRMLASLPVTLIPGDIPFEAAAQASPVRISLITAWACALLAATAVGVLLRGVVTLSERRAAFVSAVTHELRTPLTTLRMYTEMLAQRMVPDEQKRGQYLETMQAEADRLAHLVENVLSFSRLEHNGARGHIETLPLPQLLARVQPRLVQRAEQAGMSLVLPAEPPPVRVRADVGAVEQILFNLVDNACKYAAAASDRTIRIDCENHPDHVAITVRDQGPGISRLVTRRLFRPFSKSAHDAAHSAPGVGLGLALSRRLARTMGGDLRLLTQVETGAGFVLSLPRAAEP